MVDSHIAPSMRRQIRHIYALYGRQGLRALKEALFGNPDSHWNLRGESHTRNTDRPDFNREYVEAVLNRPPEAVAAQRNRLLAQYEVEVANLDKLLESVSSALEQRAHRLVNGRLAESRAEVVKEGLRYITQSKDTLIQVFETLHSFPMTGNEVLALAKAVVRIDDARLRLNEAERLQQEISAPAAAKRADWISSQLAQTAFADPTGLGYYEPRSVTELEEQASAFFPDTSGMLRAAEISAQKKTDFLNVVAAEAVTFPILFRLWEPADLAAPLRTKLAKAVKFRGFDADDEFSRAVVGVLSAAWKAVNGCQSRIANKTFNVWRYPPVITVFF